LRKKAATTETLTATIGQIGWKKKARPKVKAAFRLGQKSMELGEWSWAVGVGRHHCLLVLIKP